MFANRKADIATTVRTFILRNPFVLELFSYSEPDGIRSLNYGASIIKLPYPVDPLTNGKTLVHADTHGNIKSISFDINTKRSPALLDIFLQIRRRFMLIFMIPRDILFRQLSCQQAGHPPVQPEGLQFHSPG
jgi:hypothetical protein